MQFQKLNRENGESVFIVCRNISGATLSAGAAVYFEGSTPDGNAVSGARTNKKFLFAGIQESAKANSSYGRVQVYGVASAYVQMSSSAISVAIGDQLNAVQSATYLTPYVAADVFTAVSSAVWSGGNPWNFVTLLEGHDSSAAGSTPALHKVFVRAM